MPNEITCAACGKPAPPGLWGAGWIGVTPAGMVLRRDPKDGIVQEPGGAPPRARSAVVCSEGCLHALGGRV